MPNPTLLSILAVMIAVFFGGMWLSRMINERGDEILFGVVNGIPASSKDRWLMLITNWLPYTVFLIVFLLIMALGVLELARGAEEPRVRLVGYICATAAAGAALFWSVLGSFLFANMLSAVRNSD